MVENDFVSVIVPTKNSEATLDRCLSSIKNQTYKSIEIIVVDNNSVDKSKAIAGKYTKKVYNKGPERSSQRNFGSQEAQGDYLVFIDSDMELMPNVIEECVEVAQSMSVEAVVIPEISVGETFWAKCKALEKRCYMEDETIEAARFF